VVRDIDDQGIALPMRARITHPELDSSRSCLPIEVNQTENLRPFERDCYPIRRLENLEGKFHIHDPRDTRHIAICQGIGRFPVCKILQLFLGRPRLIGNLATVDNAYTGRHAILRTMVLKVVRRSVANVPNTLKIWHSVRCPRQCPAARLARRQVIERDDKNDRN